MGIAVALANWYNQFKRLNKGDGYTMNLFCEEVHKLEAEFKQCRKLLNAIGDENRQHLICVMMNMPYFVRLVGMSSSRGLLRSNYGPDRRLHWM